MSVLATLGGISLGLGVLGSIGGMVEGALAQDEIRKQRSILSKQRAEQEGWFNRQYYQDATDSVEVANLLRKNEESDRAARKQAEASGVVTGASDDAKLATIDSLNKSKANFNADVASRISELKGHMLNNWLARLDDYYGKQTAMSDKMAGVHTNNSNQWMQMASNAYTSGFNAWSQPDVFGKVKPDPEA